MFIISSFQTSSQAEAALVLCQDSENTDSNNESDASSNVTAPESESIDRGMYSDDDGASDPSPIPIRSESQGEEKVVVIAQPDGTACRVDNSASEIQFQHAEETNIIQFSSRLVPL